MVVATSPPFNSVEGEFNVEERQMDMWAWADERGVKV